MKRMLINATHEEELRVAIVDGQKLNDLDIEHKSKEQKKSNIYKAKITRVEPSLEAAFVDYGADRHGFLPFKEISRDYLSDAANTESGRPNVKAGLKEGQEIVIQIEKEERSNKGAALTSFISLAGRFLVLMPNNPRAGGVSRRIEGDDRAELRAAMNELVIPNGMGIIIRTAGVGRSAEELQWDLDYQIAIWEAIQGAAEKDPAPFLIYQESNIIVRALRDYFRGDIGEILVDEEATFEQARDFIRMYMPQNERKLKMHTDDVPLFNRYQIESQIETAFQREVRLPSGGSLVIDHTEALISIDINSARATKGSDIEETATNTNLEAADEVARQLRLRDLGGLVVIDFIDMLANKNQRSVENRLREALKVDRARVQVGKISRFGLLEMSRQRLRPSLGESSQIVCPRCQGHGTVRGIESTALSILRLLEEEAMKDNTERVVAEVPVEVATYLLNEKRQNIGEIEARNQVGLLIVANPAVDTPNYVINRVRKSEADHDSGSKKSYELASTDDAPYTPPSKAEVVARGEVAAVRTVTPDLPAPQPHTEEKPKAISGLRKLFGSVGSLFATPNQTEEVVSNETSTQTKARSGRNRSQNRDRNERSQNDQNQKRGNRGSRGRRNKNDKNKSAETANTETDNAKKNNSPVKAATSDAHDTEREPRRRGPGRRRQKHSKDEQKQTQNQAANQTDSDKQQTTEKNQQEGAPKSRSRRGRGNRSRNKQAAENQSTTTDRKQSDNATQDTPEPVSSENKKSRDTNNKPEKSDTDSVENSKKQSGNVAASTAKPAQPDNSAKPEQKPTEQPNRGSRSDAEIEKVEAKPEKSPVTEVTGKDQSGKPASSSDKKKPQRETSDEKDKQTPTKDIAATQTGQLKSTVRSLADRKPENRTKSSDTSSKQAANDTDAGTPKATKAVKKESPSNAGNQQSEKGLTTSPAPKTPEMPAAQVNEPPRSSFASKKIPDVSAQKPTIKN